MRREFTPDEISYLRGLWAVSNVTPTRIIYSDEFKEYFLREHGKGRGGRPRSSATPDCRCRSSAGNASNAASPGGSGRTVSTGPWSRCRRKRTACPRTKGSSRRRGIFWMACSSCYPGPNGSSTCLRRNGGRSGRTMSGPMPGRTMDAHVPRRDGGVPSSTTVRRIPPPRPVSDGNAHAVRIRRWRRTGSSDHGRKGHAGVFPPHARARRRGG